MSCALTTGYTLDCRDGVGGIKEVKIGTLSAHAVTSTTGVVQTLTTSGWYSYQMRPETADFTETEQTNDANGTVYYEQTLNFVVHKLQTTMRNELRLLAQNRLVAVVSDRNGKYWLIGSDTGLIKNGAAATGKAMGDQNGYTITLSAKESYPMLEVSSGIYTTLVP